MEKWVSHLYGCWADNHWVEHITEGDNYVPENKDVHK